MSNALLAELAAERLSRQPPPATAAAAAAAAPAASAAPDAEFPLTVKMVDKSEPVTVTVSLTSTVGDLITRLTAKGVRPKILAFAGKRLLPGDTGRQLQAAGVRRGGPVAICVGSRVSSSSGTAPTACAQNADSNPKKLSKEELEEFKAVFTLFDRNGDGFLDASELKATMASLGERVTDAQAAEMIVEADSNGDGKLDFGEFVAMMGGASEKRLREGGAAANEPPPAKKVKQGDRENSPEDESVYYDLQIVDANEEHLLGGPDAERVIDYGGAQQRLELARSEFADAVRDVKDAQEDLSFEGTQAPYTVILSKCSRSDDDVEYEEIAREVVRPRAAALRKRRQEEGW